MKIYAKSSYYITHLISKFQNNEINKNTLNNNILLNTIFTHYYFKKEDKKYKKIKENQTKIIQSFYKVESIQQEHERLLKSKIRDKESKQIVMEAIKDEREKLLKEVSKNKDITIFTDHTYNSYIPIRNISLGYSFQAKIKNNNNKKYIPYSNLFIQTINPNLTQKGNKMITNCLVSSPFVEDFDFEINRSEDENESFNNNENEDFMKMINNVDDDILFYDEKLGNNENRKNLNEWSNKFKKDEFLNDFQDLKYRKTETIVEVNDIYFNQDKRTKKKMDAFIADNEAIYAEVSKQNHYNEFQDKLSEKTYTYYIKKMNYSYLLMMLQSFDEYEKFASNYYEIFEEESKILVIFLKKFLLSCGISSSKIYKSIVHVASSKKGHLTFEDYLSCFMPIFNLSQSFQSYKYDFLLYLVKNINNDIITLKNYRHFLHIIRGKLIYSDEICDDIVGKLLFIIKRKYPRDDMANLNYQHINIYLQYLVNCEYGE